MFSACIHCTADLGRNEVVEAFPIGSRLAFDPARGRLWVVCRGCERWNLSPLDERWEAIETLERRFRDARLRVSTDNVGLARLREGLDLIRIGEPQRPEMAAWRYGDQFGRRRKRQLAITGLVTGSVVALAGGIMAAGASIGAFAGVYANMGIWDTLINGRPDVVVSRFAGPSGRWLTIRRRHARMSALEKSDGNEPFWLRLEHEEGTMLLHGREAMHAAARLMPTVNRFGGSTRTVRRAVDVLESSGTPDRVLERAQQLFGVDGHAPRARRPSGKVHIESLPGVLSGFPVHERLALEMALHEESERRAMDGELADLEQRWREAEEIAAIADSMFDDEAIAIRLGALRNRRSNTND